MNPSHRADSSEKPDQDKSVIKRIASNDGDGLPLWLTGTVVLVLLALLTYNVIAFGPKGYPTSMILGGLLGAYAGVDQLLKRRGGDGQ